MVAICANCCNIKLLLTLTTQEMSAPRMIPKTNSDPVPAQS
jgi:hypothetical protein